jgi:hypothetical protein
MRRGFRILGTGWAVAVTLLVGYLIVPVFVEAPMTLGVQHGLWYAFIGIAFIMVVMTLTVVIMTMVVLPLLIALRASRRNSKEGQK